MAKKYKNLEKNFSSGKICLDCKWKGQLAFNLAYAEIHTFVGK
jgi:hypothetical protein